MSYQISNYNQSTRNPFGGPAKTTPFPGWGILPYAAGPARIGVGSPDGLGLTLTNVPKTSSLQTQSRAIVQPQSDTTGGGGGGGGEVPAAASSGWPWWIWLAAPLALGGAGLFAYDYFTSKPRAKANARRRRSVMTKHEVVKEFYRSFLPAVRGLYEKDGRVDKVAAWDNYKAVLRRDGMISSKQAQQWTRPA